MPPLFSMMERMLTCTCPQFHVYQKPRAQGHGTTKRATCNHCNGDWAYNETRLKQHIVDSFRGCRKIPQSVRDRIRAADAPSMSAGVGGGGPGLPPTKRKRESGIGSTGTTALPPVDTEGPPAPGALSLGPKPEFEAAPRSVQLRVSVEFSVSSGGLLRATWIVAEMIQEFHRDVVVVSLVPSADENTFNIWIGGKVVWSRAPGHPLPDFAHLRPLVRAHVVC